MPVPVFPSRPDPAALRFSSCPAARGVQTPHGAGATRAAGPDISSEYNNPGRFPRRPRCAQWGGGALPAGAGGGS